ncbi:ABC transporter substrate-binding protein [Prauserella marina]|uniref:Virulence factor Mce family protein n=1 Tax=Prauserella marina TaxID=530584 RepID=A0A222VL89_9PSEU|nr:MlaD family protein [Prauserella marina]ASR34690.1 ABC transporter substrate-binding protein [Prauserella marina]PWV85651.1 virulence factor Mce-like protein [Prauserella marina]SDC49366.1 virulence factor Mce family protein [Prauserella marina]
MTTTRMRLRLTRIGALALVAGLFLAAVLWWVFARETDNRVTAYFTRAVGVYSGSDVRVLGVRVGQVESVTPKGEQVEVVMTVERDAPVATNTHAVIVAPSVVADRYVQLSDLARGGPSLTDGTVIPATRTATPVELDELYTSLNDLVTALGPDGANGEGALSDLLDTGAANMRGNGTALSESIRNFADLTRTLSGSEGDLFGTIDELQKFTDMLAGNDSQVRLVADQLSRVWQTLSADREELAAALNTLGTALADVQAFIKDNRAAIQANVDKLAGTTQTLVNNRASLAEVLDDIPLAVENAYNTFDPSSGTMQGRTNLLEYLPIAPTSTTGGGP